MKMNEKNGKFFLVGYGFDEFPIWQVSNLTIF